MKNRIIYDSPEVALNESKIKIFVFSEYERNIPSYYTDNNITPIYDVSNEECISFVSITEIIHMVNEKVEFRIADKEDVDYIVLMIKSYLEYIKDPTFFKLEGMPKDQQEFVTYCENALKCFGHHKEVIDVRSDSNPVKTTPKITDLVKSIWRG